MLYKEAVDIKIIKLIKELQQISEFKQFYLAGGTALALQLGHRKSADIDLFTNKDFNQTKIHNVLTDLYGDKYHNTAIAKNSCTGYINDIKTDFLAHRYKILDKPVESGGIRMLGINDISAMKLNAIYGNGTRVKDFIDIYYLLEIMSLDKLLKIFEKKYHTLNSQFALKSLTYFDDVRLDDWPQIIQKNITWEKIKNRLIKASRNLIIKT